MTDIPLTDYSALDKPEILHHIFYPRQEYQLPGKSSGTEIFIPVERDVALGARFHMDSKDGANILFFHGNGEIVSDYDDLGPFYNRMGINFLPVDYRGYGRSGGSPSVSSMMSDCRTVYEFTKKWLGEHGYSGPLIVMGRSLGSASALELASKYESGIDGLIIESGFAYTEPLLRLLGADLRGMNLSEKDGLNNLDKIRSFKKPILIIHAEFDHIIPFSDGQAFYDAATSRDKMLLKIPGANHNDIFSKGLMEYMAAVKSLVGRVSKSSEQ